MNLSRICFSNGDTVTELMAAKPPQPPPRSSSQNAIVRGVKHFLGRDGLQAYIEAPDSFPPSRVIYYNKKWVLIHDLYPKGSVHLLLLPRDLRISHIHPVDAFRDAAFLADAKQEAEKAAWIAASELQRMYCSGSATERKRLEAMEADDPPSELPPGRDWRKDIKIGIHKGPSMNNLHIHVISQDMHGACLRHRKHYNSFNTPFFIPLDDFPVSDDDERLHRGYMENDMKCWRCGKNFGHQFKKLQDHLENEWEEWKRE